MAKDISVFSMLAAYIVLLVSIGFFRFLKIHLYKELFTSVARMSVQLLLVGLYLSFLFAWNNPFVTVFYILLMIGVANLALLKNSGIRLTLFTSTFPALLTGIGSVLFFFMLCVYSPSPVYEASYLIPIAGMLLGNSMNRTIISLERFYTSVRKDSEGFASTITMGATVREAALPYIRTAYKAGLAPALANMATMGLVSLPGMMTGQILGGSQPSVAVKYQITIMLAIFAATEIATILAIFLSLKKGFNTMGFLRDDIFIVR